LGSDSPSSFFSNGCNILIGLGLAAVFMQTQTFHQIAGFIEALKIEIINSFNPILDNYGHLACLKWLALRVILIEHFDLTVRQGPNQGNVSCRIVANK